MEYKWNGPLHNEAQSDIAVLILVLMEYKWNKMVSPNSKGLSRLNPCFNGIQMEPDDVEVER